MGANQSIPKITPQDRAILEFVPHSTPPASLTPPTVSNCSATSSNSIKRRHELSPQAELLADLDSQIQVILDREHAIAKAHLATGQKDRAIIALRRRKYQQSLLLKTDGQLETLEELVCPSVEENDQFTQLHRSPR
jgi:charged multivesicular body protein 6